MLATANLLMALAGGLGLWTFGIFNLEGMRNISFGLGVWTIAAWTIAGFVGGFVAVTVSRCIHSARCLCLRFGDLGCHMHNGSGSYVDLADGLHRIRYRIKRHGQRYRTQDHVGLFHRQPLGFRWHTFRRGFWRQAAGVAIGRRD